MTKRKRRSWKMGNRLPFAKLMLQKLGDKTIHRTDWEISCHPCSYSYFRSTLEFLLDQEFVERIERGIYRITEKGKKFGESI